MVSKEDDLATRGDISRLEAAMSRLESALRDDLVRLEASTSERLVRLEGHIDSRILRFMLMGFVPMWASMAGIIAVLLVRG